MTDEQYGRAWAKQQGLAPSPPGSMSNWGWWWTALGEGPCLPRAVFACWDHAAQGYPHYPTEAEAFAALGKAVQAVHAEVPPLAGGFARSVFPEGADTTTTGRILVQVNTVGLGYFQTIGIPLIRGRDFTRADTM